MIRVLLILVACLAAIPSWAQQPYGPPGARPWDAVGRLTVAGRFTCTATLVAPTVVLTAAHCVLDDNGRPHPVTALRFEAGALGPNAFLYRDIAAARVHPRYRPAGLLEGSDTSSDIAMLDLAWPVQAHEVLPIPVGSFVNEGHRLLLPNYGASGGSQLIIQRGCLIDLVEGPVLRLLCQPRSGASGAPLVAGVGPDRRVIGVLSNARRGMRPRAFAVRADLALLELARGRP